MRITRSLLAATALALTLASSSAWGGDPAPKGEETVAAKRYKTWVIFENSPGDGMWIEELFFPDKGVCANVEIKVETRGKEIEFPHVLNAFYGPIRNKFTIRFEEQPESPVEDVKVPASVATAIFDAADLHKRLEEARHAIGRSVFDLGLCHDLDGDGKPREKTAEPAMK